MSSIHISDVKAFRQCRRKWSWSSPLRDNLEPMVIYAPFFTGRAIHAALEFFYRDGVPFNKTVDTFLNSEEVNMDQLEALWPMEEKALDEQIFLIRQLIDHYALWTAQDRSKYSDANLEFISLEEQFELPMPLPGGGFHDTITIGGRLDGMVKHKDTGKLWIWETKTAKAIGGLVNTLSNDEQCGLYIYAARQMWGDEVEGMLYNVIGKTPPAQPKVLDSGLLSQNKQANTSSFFFLRAVWEEHPDWTDETIQEHYGGFIESLREKNQKFFRRHPVYRTNAELKILMEGIYWTGMEMLSPMLFPYAAPGWFSCGFCSFKAPCLAMNMGADYRVLLREEYQTRVSATSMREEAKSE